jgi:hypothetical protein
MAVGKVTLVQLLMLGAPLTVVVRLTNKIGVPTIAAGDIGLAVAWFVLGFTLYAFLFAATAALVNTITEVSSAILPVAMILVVGSLLAITVVSWTLRRLEHRRLDVPINRAAGNADQMGLWRGPRLPAPAGYGTNRRQRGAACPGRLIHLSPRPAHHRSPGQAARDIEHPARFLKLEQLGQNTPSTGKPHKPCDIDLGEVCRAPCHARLTASTVLTGDH